MVDPLPPPDLLTAREAARRLGVKHETLYAYVSRGLVRSLAGPKPGRRLYVSEDVERWRARHAARAGHTAVAAGALRWGEPVLETALTQIDPAVGPRYRGRAAASLATEGARFEDVATLLWTGAWPPDSTSWLALDKAEAARDVLALLPRGARPLTRLAAVVPVVAAGDPSRFGAGVQAEWARAGRLIHLLAAAVSSRSGRFGSGASRGADSIAGVLASGFGLGRGAAVRALDIALVLSADHELNASTFAVRVTASTGADLYACVSAGLAALSGPRHGGACDRVEALVAETARPARARDVVRDRSRRGESVPGFGHPLYPQGDPRAGVLLAEARRRAPRPPQALQTLWALAAAMSEAGQQAPTLDAALVALSLALGLPGGSAAGLFAVGRSAGWIAHALEQRAAGFLLRPRAHYVGRDPLRTESFVLIDRRV